MGFPSLAAEIGEARHAGVPWAEVCATTNLNRHEAMNPVSVQKALEGAPAEKQEPDDGRLLMSVQEYAKHADISER